MERKTIFTIAFVYLSVILILGLVFFIKRGALFFFSKLLDRFRLECPGLGRWVPC